MISPSEREVDRSLGATVVMPLEFESLEALVSSAPVDIQVIPVVETQSVTTEQTGLIEQQLAKQAAEIEERLEDVRSKTWEEARRTLEREYADKVALERGAIVKLSEQFARERTKYFAAVEAEVVRLALSIAQRVLNREASFDPLLLRGAVKVALEKIQQETAVTLRVPDVQVEEWRAALPDAQAKVTVIGDPKIDQNECVLETVAGRAELGVKAQLKEIERGFFDLLEQRPA